MTLRLLTKTPAKVQRDRAVAACRAFLVRPRAAVQQFDFPTSLVGTSKWVGADGGGVNVYYDPSLGTAGLANAQNVLAKIDDLMAYCDSVFGVKGKAGNVIVAAVNNVTDGSGGAYHYGCAFNADGQGSDWYEDMSADPQETFGLVMAEVCESYMGLQNKGWNCGGSGGEGLSRFLAEIVSGGPGGSLGGFASGPSWDGADWISKDQGTDGDYPSIGCAILYLWWMTSLGYTPAQIVQAGEPDGTLATNYAALTGKPATQAFSDFKAAVAAAGGPTSDNPWNAPTPPYPLSGQPVPPVPPGPATGFSGTIVDVYANGLLVTSTAAPVPATDQLGGANWQWLIALAKLLAPILKAALIPVIQAWIANLPLPPAVISELEAILAGLGGALPVSVKR